jgi:Pvc16 N-terminal domain/IPT/TIG domain
MTYLAVGSVTRSIAELLGKKLNKPPLMGAGATFRVTTLPPDDDRVNEETGINLFLYRIHENPFTKNMDWRGDKVSPVRNSKPPLSLVLSYLLTAYAKAGGTPLDDITAHQLLGNAMAILHDYPVLNDIHDSDFDAGLDTQFPPELRNAFDKIKVSMLPTTMEEFSKIWTGLSKAYRLSVAYEVSLVEIGSTTPPVLPAPGVQQPSVRTATFGGPQLSFITPAAGPVGATVRITGSNLQQPGKPTSVLVGDDAFSEDELVSVSPQEIDLVIPSAPASGPSLPITVSIGGTTSPAALYEVTPWITGISPLRGITGIPIVIPLTVPQGAAVSVDVDGTSAATTVDPSGTFVTAIVPTTLASNGPKPVVVTINGQRSNARLFDVLPLITSVAVATSAAPVTTTLTITGERLSGQDVSAAVAGIVIRGGANTNATQLVLTVSRTLPATAPLSVSVDGSVSNTIPPRLDSISPSSVLAGGAIVLTGDSLRGRDVVVSFDGTSVDLGAQSFGSRVRLNVPGSLPTGTVQVSVTVDGRTTNELPLAVQA